MLGVQADVTETVGRAFQKRPAYWNCLGTCVELSPLKEIFTRMRKAAPALLLSARNSLRIDCRREFFAMASKGPPSVSTPPSPRSVPCTRWSTSGGSWEAV